MQTFTRFYGKVAYLGTISDFSTSLRFLFYELISRFQILISVISPRAYEISPSVGPLDFSPVLRGGGWGGEGGGKSSPSEETR